MSFRYARANVVVADERPNLVRGQFMVPLMVDGRAMALAGDWFEEALTQSGADMFATNACYGAQQRVLAEYPFPGRLVQKGLRVAIAARDTLEASAAAIFYSTFYRCLADGLSIVEAYREASESLIGLPFALEKAGQLGSDAWDRATRWAVQLVLWVRSFDELDMTFSPPVESSYARVMADYLAVTPHQGPLSEAAGIMEDSVWSSQPVAIVAGNGCDLSDESIGHFMRDSIFAFSPPKARIQNPDPGHDIRTHRLEALSDLERADLISRRFSGASALLDLMVDTLPADIPLLDGLAALSGGEVADGLIQALAWGSDALGHAEERCRSVERYFHDMSTAVDVFLDQEEKNSLSELSEVAYQMLAASWSTRSVINIAIPILGVGVQSVTGAPVPLFFAPGGPASLQLFANCEVGGFARDEEHFYVTPYHWCQLAARRRVTAVDVALARHTFGDMPAQQKITTWNMGTRRAAASWLSLAVAARQCGLADVEALGATVLILGTEDYGAAKTLVSSLRDGRPEWPPLQPEAVERYDRLLKAIAVTDTSADDTIELTLPETTTTYALALLHARRPTEAVAVTSKLAAESESMSLTVATTHAYALARTGRVAEALAATAPLISQLPNLPLYEQCELLHLLGDLAEHRDRYPLAVHYFMQERALSSPALHRRLHNRHHLYTALRRAEPTDLFLAQRIAEEGFDLSRESSDTETLPFFAEQLAELARLIGDTDRLAEVLRRSATTQALPRSAGSCSHAPDSSWMALRMRMQFLNSGDLRWAPTSRPLKPAAFSD